MHKSNLPKIYYFIDNFIEDDIKKLDKRIAIIFRNYQEKYSLKTIEKIRDFCRLNKRKFYISNNIKLAINLGLNGVYIPSFNKNTNLKNFIKRKDFEILGSAHNQKELIIKEKQGCKCIFLAPIFKVNKSKTFLGISKFNLIASYTNKKIIALGGIDSSNIKKLNLTKSYGFASISYIKKNGLNKFRPFLNILVY